MAKYILATFLAFALLLAGCAGTIVNNGNGNNTGTNISNGTGNGTALPPGKGIAIVTVRSVVSGCGIQPPDGNMSSCGVHSATPIFGGKFNLSIYSINTKTMQPGLPEPANTTVETDANGQFSLDLLPGDYMLRLYESRGNGIESDLFSISAGKTTQVSMNFTYQVPGARPY